jgi:hypothetical protein
MVISVVWVCSGLAVLLANATLSVLNASGHPSCELHKGLCAGKSCEFVVTIIFHVKRLAACWPCSNANAGELYHIYNNQDADQQGSVYVCVYEA